MAFRRCSGRSYIPVIRGWRLPATLARWSEGLCRAGQLRRDAGENRAWNGSHTNRSGVGQMRSRRKTAGAHGDDFEREATRPSRVVESQVDRYIAQRSIVSRRTLAASAP